MVLYSAIVPSASHQEDQNYNIQEKLRKKKNPKKHVLKQRSVESLQPLSVLEILSFLISYGFVPCFCFFNVLFMVSPVTIGMRMLLFVCFSFQSLQ